MAAVGVVGGQDLLFAVKTFVAAMLAYGLALQTGLANPFWAITTCFIVAQPLAGAVLSKAVFRLIGTFIGAAVAIALVPWLVDAPELLVIALALWLGLCTYLSMLDRSPRAYIFLLSGYTAAIIGFPSVAAPGQIFETAVVRCQEIGIGILTSTLVHTLVFPRSVTALLMQRIARMMADAVDLSCAVLAAEPDHETRVSRQRLGGDFAEIDTLAVHLPYDMNRQHIRQDLLQALQHELMQILALAGAVGDRMRRLGDAAPQEIAALLADVTHWLRHDGEGAALISRARALEPPVGPGLDFHAALRLSLLDRLAALITAHQHCRELCSAIRQPRRPLSPLLAAAVQEAHRPKRHLDHGIALRAAVATAGTILVGCTVWIAAAWPDGASAVVLASIICALYANLDQPGKATRPVLYGVVTAVAIAALYRLVLMPQISEFPVLALALAPAFLMVSLLNQQSRLGAFSIGLIIALPGLLGLGDRYDDDFAKFANNAVALVLGAGLASVMLALVRGVGARAARLRLMTAARRALAQQFDADRSASVRRWLAAMLDRVALLSMNAGASGEDAAEQISELLRWLRLGISIHAIRAASRQVGARDAILLNQLLRRGQRQWAADRTGAPSVAAFELAIRRLSGAADPEVRRSSLLAIISLRCNL